MTTKMRHIRLTDEEWNALAQTAEKAGYNNRTAYIVSMTKEQVIPVATKPVKAIEKKHEEVTPVERVTYRLADVVAKWSDADKKRWSTDKWKAEYFVKLVIDTINNS